MSQLNFFSPYLKTEKTSPVKPISVVFVIILLITVVSYVVLQLQIFVLKSQIAAKERVLASMDTVELQYLADTKEKIANLTNFQAQMGQTENAINEKDFIKLEFLQKFFAAVPSDILFQDLVIEQTEWRILGTAKTRAAIAEFEYNLRKSGIVNEIEVTDISLKSFLYEFNMTGTYSGRGVKHEN